MSILTQQCSAVILAGGQSKRMGSCKALLKVDGQPILSRLCRELSCFEPIFLSINQPLPTLFPSVELVQDIFDDCGPLAGIHAALSKTQKEALFCISCDLPFFSSELISFLTEQLCEQTDVLICQDHTGKNSSSVRNLSKTDSAAA